jgi:hypothetical protein
MRFWAERRATSGPAESAARLAYSTKTARGMEGVGAMVSYDEFNECR